MNSSQQPKVKTIKHLAYILGSSQNELLEISNNIDKFYYQRKEPKYDRNGKPKLDKNGIQKVRVITPSKGRLKKIQEKIHRRILAKIPLPKNIKGAVKGNDNIKNAKYHQGNKFKFATDLKDFYPSVSHFHVIKTLLRNGFSKKVASLITKLTTYKGELPQGTPTSPVLANLVFLPIDFEIIEYCDTRGIKYTRYVDDLSFSSKSNFKKESIELLEFIKQGGFKISHKKTFYTPGIAEFTGIQVKNNTIDVPTRIREKMNRDDLRENQKKGIQDYTDRVIKTNKKKKPVRNRVGKSDQN